MGRLMSNRWKKRPPTPTDRALARNGAYRPPDIYDLLTDAGLKLATIHRRNTFWRYTVPGKPESGAFADLGMCKAAAVRAL